MSRPARLFLALALGVVASAAVATAVALVAGTDSSGRVLPACARADSPISRPRDLPSAFPFPEGTAFTARYRNRLTHGVPQVDGRMPLGLSEATRFLNDELPRAGFRIVHRERGEREFYVFYETTGYGGHLSVKPLTGCVGATAFSVSARPTLLGRNNAQ